MTLARSSVHGASYLSTEAPIPMSTGQRRRALGTAVCSRIWALTRPIANVCDALFFEPARRMSHGSFVLAGPLYPDHLRGGDNVRYFPHVPPSEHGAFYRSCTLTLNVTRAAMKHYGYCPSGRLFEAAASGAVILSDWFEGLDRFLEPGRRFLVAKTSEEAMEVIERPSSSLAELRTRGWREGRRAALRRARARELEAYLELPSKKERHAHDHLGGRTGRWRGESYEAFGLLQRAAPRG